MHTHQGLVLGLFVIQGCIPAEERDDSSARHYSGAEWRLDPNGNVVGVEGQVQTESHTLIEELMILANEQVATYLAERKLPTLYRVH